MSDQTVRVAVLGAAGRMGSILSSMFARDARFELVARVDRRLQGDVCSAGVGMPPIVENLDDAPQFDVLVDFSTPAATESAVDIVARRGSAWLVATTGICDATREKIEALGAKQPIFIAANTSLGIALMQRLASQAAVVLADWDCEIVETHHRNKVDAPSGTAKALAETVNRSRAGVLRSADFVYDRTARRAVRPDDEIGISTLRGGTVAGQHQIFWFGEREQFEIRHCAEDRAIFAQGAVKITSWLSRQTPGLYTMDRLLDDIL